MKPESNKIITFIVIFVLIVIFVCLVYNISAFLIFYDNSSIEISEDIYYIFAGIPYILGIFTGMFFVIPMKAWNMISFIYNINKKVDAVQIQAFLDARCRELGWRPVWDRSGDIENPEKERKGK